METQEKVQVGLPPLVARYVAEVMKSDPAVKVVMKKESRLMRAIGWFFSKTRINQTFMDDYYTTIGSTVYVPDQALHSDPQRLLEVMMHELLHASDNRKWPLFFAVSYLSPQVFALLALLAPFISWWLLLSLLFLAPIPSPFRYHWELRAYRTSVIFSRKVYGYSDTEMNGIYNWVVGQLAKKYYYFTWPFPERIVKDLKDESFMTQPEYVKMIEFLKKEELLLQS